MTPRKKKYVTLETFLRKLRKTPRVWGFYKGPRFTWRIRLNGESGSDNCPLAVVFGKPEYEAPMPRHMWERIANAADNFTTFGSSFPSPTLRRRLLRACGLTETP